MAEIQPTVPTVQPTSFLAGVYYRWLLDPGFHLTPLEVEHLKRYMDAAGLPGYNPTEEPLPKATAGPGWISYGG